MEVKSLNPCSNGMALELLLLTKKYHYVQVLILVLMEWRWNILFHQKKLSRNVLILVLMEWRWNTNKLVQYER